MAKPIIFVALISLWLFAVLAPPVIALMDSSSKTLVMGSLNEEEHQEQGKKEIDEKDILLHKAFSFLSSLPGEKAITCNFCVVGYPDHTKEIYLPPPEHII